MSKRAGFTHAEIVWVSIAALDSEKDLCVDNLCRSKFLVPLIKLY